MILEAVLNVRIFPEYLKKGNVAPVPVHKKDLKIC